MPSSCRAIWPIKIKRILNATHTLPDHCCSTNFFQTALLNNFVPATT